MLEEVALHTDGGTLIFNGHLTHEQFVDLFRHAIGADRDNQAVILTGSGGSFMEEITLDGFRFFHPAGLRQDLPRGRKGPDEPPRHRGAADRRGERADAAAYPSASCSPTSCWATPSAVFQDRPHFRVRYIVSGDGVHLLWQEAIGTIRGRYFILTRQELGCRDRPGMGQAVNEVVLADRLLARARGDRRRPRRPAAAGDELHTRIAMTQKLRRIIDEGVTLGLALEGISAADVARRRGTAG